MGEAQLRQEPWIARHNNDVDEVVPSQYSATGPQSRKTDHWGVNLLTAPSLYTTSSTLYRCRWLKVQYTNLGEGK